MELQPAGHADDHGRQDGGRQDGGRKDRALVFTTDRGYIVPTLVVVRQLLAQPAVMDVADIVVFIIGLSAEEMDGLREMFPGGSVFFMEIASSNFDLPEGVTFQTSHVPKTTLARLFTPALIPAAYKNVVYLDGDIQILGDISPLVKHTVPAGQMMAANDQLFLRKFQFGSAGRYWRRHQVYLKSIGLDSAASYFNGGILAARLETWNTLCREALIYYLKNSALCLYHDQTALNAVSFGKREVLSPLYNYATPYFEMGLAGFSPKIVHFTGAIKPWSVGGEVLWGPSMMQPYKDILQALPGLKPYASFKVPSQGQFKTSRLGLIYKAWQDFMMRRRMTNYILKAPFQVK